MVKLTCRIKTKAGQRVALQQQTVLRVLFAVKVLDGAFELRHH